MKTYEILFDLLYQEQDYLSGEDLAQRLGISRTSIWKAIQQLERQGIHIESLKNKGYKWTSGDLLIPKKIQQHTPLHVQFNPHSISTQLDAKHGMEQGNPANTLYLAPSQTAGRGRFERSFYSAPQGGIYMSLHLRPNLHYQQIPPYTLLIAAAICKAIKELTLIELDIKWVNDLYYQQRKVAGILTEAITSIETGQVTDVIIGVGINLAIANFPEELKEIAGSLFHPEKNPLTRNELIIEIWKQFYQTDPEELIYLYEQRSLVLGRKVQFQQQQKRLTGIAKKISPQGQLLVQLKSGEECWLNSGEVSLLSWEYPPS